MNFSQAYRIGFDKPGSSVVKDATDLFDRTLDAAVRGAYSFAERLRIKHAFSNTFSGLKLARAGNLSEAVATLVDVRSRVAGSHTDCRDLIESFVLAVDAFIEYRRGHWYAAHDRLDAAERIDVRLQPRLPVLGSHLVQLHHNRMRIMLKRGAVEEAASAAFGLVEYLSGLANSKRRVSFPPSDDIPPLIRAGFIAQISPDIATIARTAIGKDLAQELSSIQVDRNLAPCRQLDVWRHVISSPSVPEALYHFIAEGRQAIPTLWYDGLALAIDMADRDEVERLALELSADVGKWTDAPESYRRKAGELLNTLGAHQHS